VGCLETREAIGPFSGPNGPRGRFEDCWLCVCSGFRPTSLSEGALDLFISAAESYWSNSSEYLPERLYTALALCHDLWALVGWPCVVPITRDSPTVPPWARVQVSTCVRACLSSGGQFFFGLNLVLDSTSNVDWYFCCSSCEFSRSVIFSLSLCLLFLFVFVIILKGLLVLF
jgi:hypothetical protein